MFVNSFWALVPPVVAIVLALIVKEPHISLFIGGFLGALLVSGLSPVKTFETYINDGILQAISDNAGVVAFVIILGIIILILNVTGGSAAFGKWAGKHIKTQTGALLATFFLGLLVFIDDMFNCFTVGAVMKPVTDSRKISRQKLAYLLDATAAPVCMIAPISSWGAAVSSTAEGMGTGISGIELFVRAIPYNFYSLLSFVFIIAIGIMNFDYGKMKQYRENALKGDLGEAENVTENKVSQRGKIPDLVIPVLVTVVACTFAMLYVGGFFDVKSEMYHSFAGAFGNTDGAKALPLGGLAALIFTFIFALCRRTISFKEATDCIAKSFITMASPLIILILAVSLKNMTTMLGAREYIGLLMQNAASNLYTMLPAVIFVVSCLLAFASGTSWGTFGILIPIVTAIFPASSQLLIIGISACLAGAVCGDHCSPISDTTIMSSAAAGCEHITHVETQLPYAVTVAAISFLMYIVAGFVQNAVLCLALGMVVTVGVLWIIKKAETGKVR